MRAFPLIIVSVLAALAPTRADESRRFFDFTPVSADNPVVATIDDTIKIPLSELRAYRNTERLQATTASLAQKRALLEDLITEYLCVDEAYRTGVVASRQFSQQMEATRTMVLSDFMATRARNGKPPAATNPGDAAAAMADRLFDAAAIDISNEAYDVFKRAAKRVDAISAASRRGPVAESAEDAAAKLHAIINATPEAVAVQYEGKSISIHQILTIYAALPAPRPSVETQDGFVALIKPLITPELMAIEAAKQGVIADPAFQDKLIQNQNALLRFYAQGLIERHANALMQAPDGEAQLRAWYEAHKADYATPADSHDTRAVTFALVESRVEADYSVALLDRLRSEKAQALRKNRAIGIDEAVLGNL